MLITHLRVYLFPNMFEFLPSPSGKFLSNGRQVEIRYFGHQMNGECVQHIFRQFLAAGSNKAWTPVVRRRSAVRPLRRKCLRSLR